MLELLEVRSNSQSDLEVDVVFFLFSVCLDWRLDLFMLVKNKYLT